MDFWERIEILVESSEITIDRPKGSKHPIFPESVYPVNYGHLTDTMGGDGCEIDVWVGSENSKDLIAIVCTVDNMKNDSEVKLLLGCSSAEIELIDQFYRSCQYGAGLVVKRP